MVKALKRAARRFNPDFQAGPALVEFKFGGVYGRWRGWVEFAWYPGSRPFIFEWIGGPKRRFGQRTWTTSPVFFS